MIQIFPSYIYIKDIKDIKERGYYNKSKLSTIEDYDSILCFTDRHRLIKGLGNVKNIINIGGMCSNLDVINAIFDLINPSDELLQYDIKEVYSDDILTSWGCIYDKFTKTRQEKPEIIQDLFELVKQNINGDKILTPYNELDTGTKY